jgi:hypothetical protein
MSMNTVCSARTVQFDSPTGPVGVIIMNLYFADQDKAHTFVRDAADKFKLQRLSSPLRTETLLVTITGELSAGRFSREWRAVAMQDATLDLMMSQLRRGEVVHTPEGMGSPTMVSLLPSATPEVGASDASGRTEPQRSAQSSSSNFGALFASSVPA